VGVKTAPKEEWGVNKRSQRIRQPGTQVVHESYRNTLHFVKRWVKRSKQKKKQNTKRGKTKLYENSH